jgi:hypothetical protein
MIQKIALITLITTRIFCQSAYGNETIALFTSPSPLPPTTISNEPAKVISINGHISNGKMLLQWIVSDNEDVAQFEIEKSNDGKNFTMAALVFGTDKTETDNYMFYEKATRKKMIYRVKIINKDQTVDYSTAILIASKD